MSAQEMMCHAHEERIQGFEAAVIKFAAHTAAEELRFQMISDQIADLGSKLTASMDALGKRVDDLAAATQVHHGYLQQLNAERETRVKRQKWVKRAMWGMLSALGIGVLEATGPDVWTWVKHFFHR